MIIKELIADGLVLRDLIKAFLMPYTYGLTFMGLVETLEYDFGPPYMAARW